MSHLGIRDDGLGHPPWCRGNATAVPATSKTAIAAGTVVLNRPPITRGTDSSNPPPSSGESTANLTFSASSWSITRGRTHPPTDRITGVAGRPAIDCRSSIGGVLRHMRCHVVLPQIGDKPGHIVRLVGAECDPVIAGRAATILRVAATGRRPRLGPCCRRSGAPLHKGAPL